MVSRISAWSMIVSCHRWPSTKTVDLYFAALGDFPFFNF